MKEFTGAILTLLIGVGIGIAFSRLQPMDEGKVRAALYEACVHKGNYDQTEKLQGGFCNRRTINQSLASVYGESYVPPMPEPEAIRAYEQPLIDLRDGK